MPHKMRTCGITRTLQSSNDKETKNCARSEDSLLEIGQAVRGEEERLREDLKTGLQRKNNHLNDRSTDGYNWNVLVGYGQTLRISYVIVKESYVDHSQFDKTDVHYDTSSKADNPRWSMVDVQFERMLKYFIPLSELKKTHLQHKAGP